MKKGLIILLAAGFLASGISTASAEYIFSFGFRSTDKHPQRHDLARHSYHPHARYPYRYCYGPSKPVIPVRTRTITKTITIRPKEAIASNREKLGISDIIFLSKSGVDDDLIIDKIAKTHSIFNLTAEEVSMLVKENVSSRVINFMLKTP